MACANDHDLCMPGGALSVQCGLPSTCVADICAHDPYCCIKEWDQQCKIDVDLYCKDKTCEPNNCAYRPAGWYCRTDPTEGAYRCDGNGGDNASQTTAEGHQCAGGSKCTTEKPGVKEPAILCTTESADDDVCPIGAKGKPKCAQ